MAEIALRTDRLGKKYRIGAPAAGGKAARSPFSYLFNTLRGPSEDEILWALKDLSLEVREGEGVGIIGRNGAGKSTLLKILSRITEPTTGRAELYGRVASLLEVGTGFHGELTGRENIFMNGAFLGMSRKEIASKFDEIVDFSGVEKFIDTPVKRYSSGMYLRLAFAVAAHLEAEILLVDEVLAVGDAQFQRKCLEKMSDVSRSGRTVLFVSHNLSAVTRLCGRTILLDQGTILQDGAPDRVVARYLRSNLASTLMGEWHNRDGRGEGNAVVLRSARVVDTNSRTVDTVDMRQRFGIQMSFDVLKNRTRLVPAIALFNEQGLQILASQDTHASWEREVDGGHYTSTMWVPGNLLNEGSLFVNLLLMDMSQPGKPEKHAYIQQALAFRVVDHGEGPSAKGNYAQTWPSSITPLLEWSLEHSVENS